MLLGTMSVLSVLAAAVVLLTGGGLLWAVAAAAGCFLGLLALALVFLWAICRAVDLDKPQEEDSPFYRKTMYLYIELLMGLVKLRMTTRGLENTPKEGRFLLVCNHQNEADPGILLHYFRKSQLAFISKQENRDMFAVGKFMHMTLCQMVNRENDREALKTILKCIQLIKEDKVSIGVFPEGGIKERDKLNPFRPGVFKIAQKTGVPIVVCTLTGTSSVFEKLRKLQPIPARLNLVGVIQPEDYAGMTTVEISERVYAMMLADLGEDYALPENP